MASNSRTPRAYASVRGPPLRRLLLVPRRQHFAFDRRIVQRRKVFAEFGDVVVETVSYRDVPRATAEACRGLIDQRNDGACAQLTILALDRRRIDLPKVDDRVRLDVKILMQRCEKEAVKREDSDPTWCPSCEPQMFHKLK